MDELGEGVELLRAASARPKSALLLHEDSVRLAPLHQSALQHARVDLAHNGEESDWAIISGELRIAVLVNRHHHASQPVHRHIAALEHESAQLQ